MSLKLTIKREDAKRGQLVDPGWYTVLIKDIEMKRSNKGDSNNFQVKMVIVTPGKFRDVPLFYNISEKAPGMAIGLLNANGAQIDPENFQGDDFDLEACINKQVDVAITNELYEGNMKNNVKDFAPAGSQA